MCVCFKAKITALRFYKMKEIKREEIFMKKFLLAVLLVMVMYGVAFGGEITLSSAVYTDNGSGVENLLMIDTGREVEFTFTITSFPLPLYFYAAISTEGGLRYHSYGATMNTLRPIPISEEFRPGDSGTVSLRIYDRIGGDLLDEKSVAIAAKGEAPGPRPNPPSGDSSSGGCNAGFGVLAQALAGAVVFALRKRVS